MVVEGAETVRSGPTDDDPSQLTALIVAISTAISAPRRRVVGAELMCSR
jgi:hypothetical protein